MFTQSFSLPLFRVYSARLILVGLFLSVMPVLPMGYFKQEVDKEVRALSANATVSLSVGEQPQELKSKVIPPEALAEAILADAQNRGIPGLEDRSVLDDNAKKELQLDLLLKTLDHTQTYVGSWMLQHAVDATNDLVEIERRQQVVQKFMSDIQLFNSVSLAMHTIAKNEESVLAYWNAEDKVFVGVQGLYFKFSDSLNKSKLALEGITLYDAGSKCKSLLGMLFLHGLYTQLYMYNYFGVPITTAGVMKGMLKPVIVDLNVFQSPNMTDETVANYRAGLVSENKNLENGIKVYSEGTFLDKVRYKEQVFNKQGTFLDRGVEWLTGLKFFGGPTAQGWNKVSAWGDTALWTAASTYGLYETATSLIKALRETHRNLEALRARMIGVAEFIKGIQKLEQAIAAHPELQNQLPEKLKHDIALCKNFSPEMQELVALLNTATFKQSKSIFYARGKVLYANKLFNEIKHELIPAMKALGEIDAYCAIARLMRVSAKDTNKFTFVTFTHSAQAYMELDSCWISVLDPDEAVANSMALGQKHSGKMIITGPNGGGKSTHLKASGQAAWMAHAWGIAPAKKARMSILDAVRTSMEPHENLEGGISKFMAQKESMDKIQQFILDEPDKVSLILLDEPYDGTVTDEIARRAGRFCDSIVGSKNCLAIVATHIMPTLVNPKLYSWYHVDIAEPVAGTFRRTFRLRRGLAKRWFADQAWRGRFIDWLSIEMKRNPTSRKAS